MTRAGFVLALLVGCTGAPAQVDEAACASICDARDTTATTTPEAGASNIKLSAFEEQLFATPVEDVRAGVRPFDDSSLGICPKGENTRRCDKMLGTDVGELAEGEYILYGSFRVPRIGDRGTWKVKLKVECEVTRTLPDGTTRTDTRNPYEREYEVVFAGEEHGYKLSPMRRITSPGKNGAEACTYTITAPHPDGDKVYTGSWSVPEAPPE